MIPAVALVNVVAKDSTVHSTNCVIQRPDAAGLLCVNLSCVSVYAAYHCKVSLAKRGLGEMEEKEIRIPRVQGCGYCAAWYWALK